MLRPLKYKVGDIVVVKSDLIVNHMYKMDFESYPHCWLVEGMVCLRCGIFKISDIQESHEEGGTYYYLQDCGLTPYPQKNKGVETWSFVDEMLKPYFGNNRKFVKK